MAEPSLMQRITLHSSRITSQGEAVASQSPHKLSRLIEQISGSLDLAGEYEKAKEAQECATENATFNFMKRR